LTWINSLSVFSFLVLVSVVRFCVYPAQLDYFFREANIATAQPLSLDICGVNFDTTSHATILLGIGRL
jgi:hypothetical protein